MYLTKTKYGYFIPSDEDSSEQAKKIPVGEEVKATRPRNTLFHRKGFALIKLGFENQDKYESMEVYRKVLTIKAGYFDEVEGKDGSTYYLPKSLSFESMSQETFEKWYNSTLEIIAKQIDSSPEEIKNELINFI